MIVDKMAKISKAGFECATTPGFADYRETMCALNNSLGPKKRLNEDTLTANYKSALTRAGLQKDFALKKVIQYRQFNGVLGELPNDITDECIRSVLHDTEALANAAAGTDASALISGKQPAIDFTGIHNT